METLASLNEEQQKAVLHTEGPLLIVAGAGAGKTKTLTHRILYLISEKQIPAERILAVTFTNKAAKEMRDRVQNLLYGSTGGGRNFFPGQSGMPFIATFHSLGVFILRENHELLKLPRNFTIFDSGDALRVLRQTIKEEGFDPKVLEPKLVRSVISKEKGKSRMISDYEADEIESSQTHNIARVWRQYEKAKKEQDALDFDDLLLHSVRLLQKNGPLREKYQTRFRYIHVDEYQDTNQLQYEMTYLLAGKKKNICVVGDADQNIYSWRGADISNILHFEKDYPGAKTLFLEQNYRSTDTILKAANAIIEQNQERIPKKLFTEKKGSDLISLLKCFSEYDEARAVTSQIETLKTKGANYGDIAVLYRTNFQSRVLENAFLTSGIPYQVLGVKFFERKEVKDVLSYLRAALNPKSIPDVSRVINTPKRGIGKVTLQKIFSHHEEKMTPKVREKIASFFELLTEIKSIALSQTPEETIKAVIEKTGLEDAYQEEGDEGQEKIANMYELVGLSKKYNEAENGMEKLLEEVALMSEQDTMKDREGAGKGSGAVRLMTIHAAKGLEFPYVFITGLEDGLFPHKRMGEVETKQSGEEERRLFYVAITRAEKKLFLSYAEARTKFGSQQFNLPSPFLDDIPKDLIAEEKPKRGLLDDLPPRTIFFD